MRPLIAAFDGFFQDPKAVREQIISRGFHDVQNPVDGVVYPSVNVQIPEEVEDFLSNRLSQILGEEIEITLCFARLTTEQTVPPHLVHSDRTMAQFSAHVYLSEEFPDGYGTSFWEHESEGQRHDDETDVTKCDLKSLDGWTKTLHCAADFNRLLIHDSELWHCAEPSHGFGQDAESGRIVLTTFFKLKGEK